MGPSSTPLPTSGTESAALPKIQAIEISEDGQASETPGPTVLKSTTEEQIVASNVPPVESLTAPPASSKTTEETCLEAADKTNELKWIPPEPTVREEMRTTEELIEHVSSQEVEMLRIESETPPTETVMTEPALKSEIVQPLVRAQYEPRQAIDSPDIIKPPTVEATLEYKETCELTSMVMYTTNVTVNSFLRNPFTHFTNIIISKLTQTCFFYRQQNWQKILHFQIS